MKWCTNTEIQAIFLRRMTAMLGRDILNAWKIFSASFRHLWVCGDQWSLLFEESEPVDHTVGQEGVCLNMCFKDIWTLKKLYQKFREKRRYSLPAAFPTNKDCDWTNTHGQVLLAMCFQCYICPCSFSWCINVIYCWVHICIIPSIQV